MSSEPNGSINPPSAPDATVTSGVSTGKQTTDATLKQTNGDSTPINPVESDGSSEEKPAEATEIPKEHKLTEESKPSGPGSVAASAGPKEAIVANKTAQPGDKREHESTTAPADTTKVKAKSATEPVKKKQKITGKRTQNGTSTVPDMNGEKKKASRSKKAKDLAKTVIPTDGIGSRTRSRTKASP
ncbi:uncharacterized protein BDW43DRAFT_103241 [Aspergillus alliaceus]|uniref:uncharacterized protein n=1 Tax=Petromyces alliaceus TaxID=209559 RepID=UPI0012A776D8|nr:uncharacterized protein BDW43DRAFT_103241 [Aspergillus alliaceus]KAB8232777.1 hypothetical protein BDW43DRAFT_103241 [Aspergillus alliaceus]